MTAIGIGPRGSPAGDRYAAALAVRRPVRLGSDSAANRSAGQSVQIAFLEARDAPHFGPVLEVDLPSVSADQALPLEIGEDAVDVDRCLAGDVRDLLLGERVDHRLMIDIDPAAGGRLAQQVSNARGRIAPSAIHQPFVADGLVALHQAQAELARVTRVATLGELTASIAHEINQPLGAMVNSANACVRWLAAQNLERARQSALAVVADGQRAADIIRRIRDLAKKAPLEKEWLDLNATIRDVIALAQSAVHRHGVVVETHLAADLPPILGDRVQLQQVLLNLVMNAIEALRGVAAGSRALWVSSELVAATEVVIAVRDSGPGFDPQHLDRLFDAFYTTKPDGMGLGLAISRRLIAAHGGRLWATAQTPHGAVFQFTVPIGSEGVA